MKIPKSTWLILLIFRVITSLLIKNVLIPDEVYQSVEVAQFINSGQGYLTWEWKYHLRGYLLPLVFSNLFSISNYLGLSNYKLTVCRIFMSLLLTLNDYITVKLSSDWFGPELEPWTLLATVFNFCHFILGPRWLGNTFEMLGITLSLYWWPIKSSTITFKNLNFLKLTISLLVGGLVCILRPTSSLIYLFLGLNLILKCNTLKLKFFVFSLGLVLVSLVVCIMIFIDTKYYREFTVVPLQFLKFNVFKGVSSYYGVHNILWYFYSGLPTILITWLPFTIIGFYSNLNQYPVRFSLKLCLLIIGIFSLLPHKEFRFIYPILPLLIVIAACGLKLTIDKYPKYFGQIIAALIITNLLPGIYINQYHHRATLPIMNYLREQVDNNRVDSIGFLMPCHSTPFYSHLQRDTPMWFLTCNPNLDHNPNYLDNEDLFYKNPLNFINTKFVKTPTKSFKQLEAGENFEYYWPSHLVIFDHLLNSDINNGSEKFENYLYGLGYRKEVEFWNSHFSTTRRSGNLVVLKK